METKVTPAEALPETDRLNDWIDSILYYGILGAGVLSVFAGFVYYLYTKLM